MAGQTVPAEYGQKEECTMDTLMEIKQMKAVKMTITCRKKPNRVKIIVLTLVTALITWLAYGAVYSFLDQGVTFWQALISPVALVFLALDIVFAFFAFTKKEAGT